MALSAAPNRRKCENLSPCRLAKRRRRRASPGVSCGWTCGMGVSDLRQIRSRGEGHLARLAC
eukprot:932645-Alexandrium_andersonii.AAC.1